MSKGSLNKAQIIGHLGQDPELRVTQQGASVCSFTIATDEGYKDQNGNQVDKPEWHKIVVWRKLADIAGKYLKKGSLVYIEGKLSTRMWEKDGHKNYTTEIIASDMTMLGSKGESQDQPRFNEGKEEKVISVDRSFDVPNTDFEEDDLPF